MGFYYGYDAAQVAWTVACLTSPGIFVEERVQNEEPFPYQSLLVFPSFFVLSSSSLFVVLVLLLRCTVHMKRWSHWV